MGTLNEDLASIKEVEDTITANKVANFAYTDKAYTDNDANGVIEYDVSKEQNIPSSDASILKVNETVLQKGYRAQASSVTRMLLNHFFGRVSYNLNKVNDCVSNLVTTLSSHLGKANGIATLDNDGHIPYSQLPESAVEYKGNWNANTNTPQLVDGTRNLGDLYIVSVAGRRDLGSGAVNYLVGDRIIYNQNNIWEKLSGGSVRSVENQLPDASGNISLPVGIYTKGLVKQSDPIIEFNNYSTLASVPFINSIVYGKGMFVAVGGNTGSKTYIVTSTDGITWTKQTSPFSNELRAIVYANGMFVAVGASGNIVTSTDGITWTKQTSPVSEYFYTITYGKGMFIVAGSSGTIVTSTDGITWTKQTSPVSGRFTTVVYGNGMFVVFAEGGTFSNYLIHLPSNSVKVEDNGAMSVPGIDELETKADSIDTKVDSLDTKVDSLDTKVDSIDTKVNSLDTKVDNLNVKANTPRWLRFDFSASNKQTLKILANTHIRVENTIVHFDTNTSFDLSTTINATSNSKGKDWYVFLDTEGNVTCSLSKTESAGKRRIGQFHTLCANAGASVTGLVPTELTTTGGNFLIKQYNEEEDSDFYAFYNKPITAVETGTYYNVGTVVHPLSGFVTNDILPESVWCLTFHPSCASYDGMVYDRDCDIAVDIYLQSGKGKATKSAFGAPFTNSRQQWNHQEDMRAVGKRLLKDYEFTSIASGSNERTNIDRESDQTTVGGHVDTNGRRMISFIGCEECCGYFFQWLDEIACSPTYTLKWDNHDGQGNFGQQNQAEGCISAGGSSNGSTVCGSRCRDAFGNRSDVNTDHTGRGTAEIIRSVQ